LADGNLRILRGRRIFGWLQDSHRGLYALQIVSTIKSLFGEENIMIALSVRNRIRERAETLCHNDWLKTNPKPNPMGKSKPYSLSYDAEECMRIYRLACKESIMPDEEEEIKAYHLTYCVGLNTSFHKE